MQDLLPLEETEQRLALAAEIQDRRWHQLHEDEDEDDVDDNDRDCHRLTTFDLSAIMFVPLDWRQKIDLPNEGGKMVEDWKMRKAHLDNPETSTTTAAINVLTCRPLRSGHTFEVSLEKEDAYNMKVMIDIQWACIQLASMSGAAGCPEFIIDSDDDDEADLSWVSASSA
ncbi:hypothetical protein GGR54DRAFT_265245 [Hypoxylon sp. NC1633]|nr:hypothetical protein GGR54DRAFT_265245 [Hypoxylon sp. NC1633]